MKRFFVSFVCLIVVAVSGVGLFYFLPPSSFSEAITVTVFKGDTLGKVADTLQKRGGIRSARVFVMYTTLLGRHKSIQPGIYEVAPGSTLGAILDTLTEGPEKKRITIREGVTVQEIDALLSSERIIEQGSLISFVPDGDVKEVLLSYGFLERKGKYLLEAFLFPDTYYFIQGSSVDGVVAQMVENFEKRVGKELTAFNSSEKYKRIIVASLIEREVANEYERGLVSDIIWKRLEADMPLQIDASIAYGVCVVYGECNRMLRKDDFLRDMGYNTYTRKGLPPGPIGSFSISALRAALSPTKSPYWYYLSTPDGRTFFSKTFEEHDELRGRYLKNRF